MTIDNANSDSLSSWNYHDAFSRNIGIISEQEQELLRGKRVAIAGLGGVGGQHLITLVRLGIQQFHIADMDRFECANTNRQYGANIHSVDREKVEVMAAQAKSINPEVEIRSFPDGVHSGNIDAFLEGVDVVLDGLDLFAIEIRRVLFARARDKGIWTVTAGPHAASTSWIVFSPTGMPFERYFAFRDDMTELEQVLTFAVGVVPSALHLSYTSLSRLFNPKAKTGSSLGLACSLASGVAGAEVLKILLDRKGIFVAPWCTQFDAYRGKCVRRYLPWGNNGPIQRLKRYFLLRHCERQVRT